MKNRIFNLKKEIPGGCLLECCVTKEVNGYIVWNKEPNEDEYEFVEFFIDRDDAEDLCTELIQSDER